MQVVYVGDGNNIVNSWLRLSTRMSFEFTCVCPPGYEPHQGTVELAKAAGKSTIIVTNDPQVRMQAHRSRLHRRESMFCCKGACVPGLKARMGTSVPAGRWMVLEAVGVLLEMASNQLQDLNWRS
eukprot:scaffold29013_cov21-Tisochrysis_lutea.AAC.2